MVSVGVIKDVSIRSTMGWLFDLHQAQPIAHAIGALAFVCVLGMALGSLKFRGIGLGTAGVLFAGIIVGHFGNPVDHHTLDFVKEFGLVLFVFTIGLQLGPGFFAALRQQGVKMNLLAASIVIIGAVSAPLVGWFAGFDNAAVLGYNYPGSQWYGDAYAVVTGESPPERSRPGWFSRTVNSVF